MDYSMISPEAIPSEVSRINSTVQDLSIDADKFLSAEDSQTVASIDVTELSLEDNVQSYTSKNETTMEEESVVSEIAFETSVEANNTQSKMESHNHTEPDDSTTIADINENTDESAFFQSKILELGRYLWHTDTDKQCYTKGCLWSPDGTCCLVPVNLDGMHLVELPADIYEGKPDSNRSISRLSSAVHVKEGGTVYDCAWYPFMNSTAPETCCWLATRQHEPIQMWDAFNGDIRATYRGYDDVDEVEAAISVVFSSDGQQVLGGYKKCIRVFETDIPGRNSSKIVTKQAISCFALTPSKSDIITTGSWNGVINLYDQRVLNMGSLSALVGHTGGITYLKYSYSGDMLFSGARKDNTLNLWDMRNFSKPIATLQRSVLSNQRIYFDLSPFNEWLISGDSAGLLNVWNLKDIENKLSFRIHGDSCNGVSFHPSKPIIATSAGQYHFVDPENHDKTKGTIVDYENSLIFWWIAPRE